MALNISERILRDEREYFPSRQVFEKKAVGIQKTSVFGHFWKIVELNTDGQQQSLLSGISNWFLFFKIRPEPNWLHSRLK